MLYLAVRHGKQRGVCWPVGGEPIVIGRSESCGIRIVDAAISRQHCRVWSEEGRLFVEDQGSRNATLVNGVPTRRSEIRIGDIISLGPVSFEVVREDIREKMEVEDQKNNTPITLTLAHGVYTSDSAFRPTLHPTPRTVQELYELFCLSRDLAQTTTLWDVALLVFKTYKRALDPQAFWLAWYREGDETLVPVPLTNASSEPLPETLMRQAVQSHQGMLAPRTSTLEGEVLETLMAVPLVHGKTCVGCVALRSGRPGRIFAEEDLQYAMGMASTVAPHVRAVEHTEQLARDNARLRDTTGGVTQLVGESPVMREARQDIERAARGSLSVLVLGESGVGKEIAARMIHELSARRDCPYVIVNCAAIPDGLFESEMFGHEKGAFTGAMRRKIGRMEEAHSGTLFLDEVADLSAENQARLLRAIETGEFRRVGADGDIKVDVRIVAATNKPLTSEAFRSDLLHRLNGMTIHLPPLRARASDIPGLARYFLRVVQHGSMVVTEVASEALERMQQHDWPGNVRELRTTIERAVLYCDGPLLTSEHLRLNSNSAPTGAPATEYPMLSLSEVEKHHILRVMEQCKGNISAAARTLGINRVTLYKRLAEYGSAPDKG